MNSTIFLVGKLKGCKRNVKLRKCYGDEFQEKFSSPFVFHIESHVYKH
jgi:hypothetical protein